MTPLLVDTDPGIDDALALLLAFGSPACSVEAITTVAGNVEVGLCTRNAGRIVAAARPVRQPVIVAGASKPLARPLVTAGHYHGADGLGDAFPPEPFAGPEAGRAPEPGASRAIIEAARRHRGMLTLVAIGPLTNIALALGHDAAALAEIGRLVVMGGALDVPGNVTPAAEFNMHVDPEAAARVLAAGLPLDLIPLDVTRRVVLARAELETALTRAPRPLAEFVAAFTRFAFRVDEDAGGRGITLHDPLALGIALDPSLATFEEIRIEIGPEGETRRRPGTPNCRVAVAVAVDAERFLPYFLERLCRASS